MSQVLTPAESAVFETLTALAARGAIVQLGPKIGQDVDMYHEPGMRARLTKFGYSNKFDCFMATLDVTEFAEHNLPLETSDWSGGKTAREAGYYKDVDEVWIDLAQADQIIAAVPDATTRFVSEFAAEAPVGVSYVSWLEAKLAAAMPV